MSVSSLRAFEYLEALPEIVHKRLYEQPSTALAVFRRMLPHLAKTYIMSMLYLKAPLPASSLDVWTLPESKRDQELAIDILDRLHIIHAIHTPGQRRSYRLNDAFSDSLKRALTGGGDHRSFGVPCHQNHTKNVTVEYLDVFARKQWESILYYIVESTGTTSRSREEINNGAKKLLELGEFVEIKGRQARITKGGFEFLLQEVNVQVWSLLIVYLENAENLQMDRVDMLSFLFMLGSLEVGQDYSSLTLSETQLQMLDDLNDFGIIYRSSDSACFYPTRLATTLTSDSNALSSSIVATSGLSTLGHNSSEEKGFIVIETNYRLYAYTNSPLRISILNLFVKLSTRFPNMVSGRLTKESIQSAIGFGITADQIISYLAVHAHPVMTSHLRSSNQSSSSAAYANQPQSTIPPTVVDQIRLWQIEGDRMQTTLGFLFQQFRDQKEYMECLRYADDVGVLKWRNDKKRLFFVTDYKQLQSFLKNRAQREQGSANGASSGRG